MFILQKELTFFTLHNHFYKILKSNYLLYTSFYLNNHYYNNNNNNYYYYLFINISLILIVNTLDSHFLKSLPLSHPNPPYPHTILVTSTTTLETTAISATMATLASFSLSLSVSLSLSRMGLIFSLFG